MSAGAASIVDHLPSLSLVELEARAGLLTRIDRKYVVPVDTVDALLADAPATWAALEIDGRRAFRYDSCYFDTDRLDSYLGAAFGRRHRFKIRTRTYTDSGGCVLEVKTKGNRGETVKVRQAHDPSAAGRLPSDARSFVVETTGLDHLGDRLVAVLDTGYVRSTVVDHADDSRFTIDQRFTIARPGGTGVAFDDLVILESKSSAAPTAADRWLWQHGHRPLRLSKFCVGMALLDPSLPDNRWHRVLHRHLRSRPGSAVAANAA